MEENNLEINQSNSKSEKYELKIANKIIGCNLQKSFKNTEKFNPENKTNLIQDIKNEELKLHQRIFYKNEQKEVGYIEVFQNSFLSYAHELSENISFLFDYDTKDNKRIDNNKCFGFRYYDLNNNYCTLLKSNDEDEDNYFFLEKLDEEDNKFYDKSLDCFQIIFYSIFSRYKKKDEYNFDFPLILERPLYEVLGFNYAILCKSNDKFQFHKIHSINIIKDIDYTNHISKKNGPKKMNIMPLLFDGHISLLFFFDNEKEGRNFILSDPSHVHSRFHGNSISINPFVFSEDMRKNLELYPKSKIQTFNSCSLWYYFQILCLINYNEKIQSKRYDDSKNLLDSIKDSSFYFDCFNYYQYIMRFEKKLIEINPDKHFDDDDYFYCLQKDKYLPANIKIHKLCFLNQFVDFIELIYLKTSRDINYKPGILELNTFRKYNEELIDFIIYLNYNINLLELNAQKNLNIIRDFKSEIEVLNDLREIFINYCIDFLSSLAKVDKEAKNLERYDSQRLKTKKIDGKYLCEIFSKINDIIKDFKQRKEKIEEKFDLYSLEITGKILFPIFGFLYKSK